MALTGFDAGWTTAKPVCVPEPYAPTPGGGYYVPTPTYPAPPSPLTDADVLQFRMLMDMMQKFMRSHEAIREQSLMELARHFGIEEAVIKALKERK